MIRIVSGSSIPVGSTVALATLCNQLNSRGRECVFYGPDRWHMDQCRSAFLSDFELKGGDTVIVHGIKLFSASDLHAPKPARAPLRDDAWPETLRDIARKWRGDSRKPDGIGIVATWQGDEPFRLKRTRYAIFDKIHYVGADQPAREGVKHPHFICPNFVDGLAGSDHKPCRVAGIVGSIRPENRTELSVERAIRDDMETVILFGYLADPVYYYGAIEPLAKKYRGRIKFAGFVDGKQKLYDSVSDVYRAVARPWDTVRRECELTNTRFHGPDPGGESMDNGSIFDIWKKEIPG